MSALDDTNDTTKQSDALLWLAGAIVVGMGVIWLVLSKPWVDDRTATVSSSAPIRSAERFDPRQAGRTNIETPLEENPLRMAQLALDAGMLVEPEEYSAWTLFRRALEQDPENEAARAGLEEIATELLRRANAAVEQGRFDDARETVTRIRDAIPVHTGANDLAIRIDSLSRRTAELRSAPAETPEETAETAEQLQAAAPAQAPAEAAEPAEAAAPEPEPQVDPILSPHESFAAALADNSLLTPVGASAKDHLGAMRRIDPAHELTREASSALFTAFIDRARQAVVEMDTASAETWLDEADALDVDTATVTALREELRGRLIEIESARRVPASALEILTYAAPEYPVRALERAIEGWVDVEFVVARDGSTRDIVVIDSSHSAYFRREAVNAIEQWRFAPRVFMGQTIEQRAYTRIRFDFE